MLICPGSDQIQRCTGEQKANATLIVTHFKRHLPWGAAWAVASLLGCVLMARFELVKLKEAFDTETQVVHLLLSQRVAQVEAVLSTVPTLASARAQADRNPKIEDRARAEQRLLSVFPHVLMVLHRDSDESWSDEPLRAGEAESRRQKRAALADVNLAKGRYHLVLAQESAGHALLIDIKTLVPWQDWPMSRETSPVSVSLAYDRQAMVLQPGNANKNYTRGWDFEFSEPLSSKTQPLVLVARRHAGWGELPWSLMASWCLLLALLMLAARALMRQRHDRHRAEALLQVGQMGRLNTLTELATGMVQELGQPINAAVSAVQNVQHVLSADSPDPAAARVALNATAQRIQQAADVVNRLRHVVERPADSGPLQRVSLIEAARAGLDLLSPELDRLGIRHAVRVNGPDFAVTAEPVALAQIIHNLLMNAIQALQDVRPSERQLVLTLSSGGHNAGNSRGSAVPSQSGKPGSGDQREFRIQATGQLSVQDNGHGIPNDVVTHILEPFFTTRQGSLGLGLSLSDTLASSMGGSLTAYNRVPRGAEFCLSLPLAP